MKSKFNNSVKIAFLLIYVFAGFYMAYLPDGSVLPFFKNVLFYCYLLVSAIIGCIGLVVYFYGKNPNAYLWICSIYWAVYSGSELVERGNVLPSRILMITMLIVSVMCMFFIKFTESRKSRGQTPRKSRGQTP